MLTPIKKRFSDYVAGFKGKGSESDHFIRLKEAHSLRVLRETCDLACDLGLTSRDREIAEVAALLHDTGRFPQYETYGTFQDAVSVDHAMLGVRVIREEGLLHGVDAETEILVLNAIRHHNKRCLPADANERGLLFSKILRDADKLDIWRIIINDDEKKDGKGLAPVEADLPAGEDLSDPVHGDIVSGVQVPLEHVKNHIDKNVCRAGWIHDINFIPTLRRIRDRRHLERTHATLPDTKRIREAFTVLETLLKQRIETV